MKSKIIPIAPELVEIILSGKKVKTYRLGKKYDHIEIGDIADVTNFATDKLVATVKITGKYYQNFKDLPVDISGHEKYKDKEHQREVFNEYYSHIGRPIRDDDEFIVFEFEFTN